MSLLEVLQPAPDVSSGRDRSAGVVIGIVTNNQDPDGLGRVKLSFPWLDPEHESDWARLATPMAGPDRGVFFLPEVDDEVVVTFEHGDIRKPVVLGGLWNGQDKPPLDNGDGANNLRAIHSRSGLRITFDDSEGSEKIVLSDAEGKNQVVIDSASDTITITSDKDIVLSAANGKIALEAKQLELAASESAKLEAGQGLDIEAGASLNINGSTINLN